MKKKITKIQRLRKLEKNYKYKVGIPQKDLQ